MCNRAVTQRKTFLFNKCEEITSRTERLSGSAKQKKHHTETLSLISLSLGLQSLSLTVLRPSNCKIETLKVKRKEL